MSCVTTEIDLSIIGLVTRSAYNHQGDYVSLVATRNGDLAIVASTDEEGVGSFIATLEKNEVMEYWGDGPLTDAL